MQQMQIVENKSTTSAVGGDYGRASANAVNQAIMQSSMYSNGSIKMVRKRKSGS